MENNRNIINGNCWVASFDILGFSKAIKENLGNLEAFVELYYGDIIRGLMAVGKYDPDIVNISWFSDTFFLFTNNGSAKSLSNIDIAARHFFVKIIENRIALRGAMSFGELYADKQNNIFVGDVPIDAYKYAECQNWLGFILTPKASAEANKLGLCPPERTKYIQYDVPCKCEYDVPCYAGQLYAFKSHEYPHVRESIEQLYKEAQNTNAGDDNIMLKYKNTLEFFDKIKTFNKVPL